MGNFYGKNINETIIVDNLLINSSPILKNGAILLPLREAFFN